MYQMNWMLCSCLNSLSLSCVRKKYCFEKKMNYIILRIILILGCFGIWISSKSSFCGKQIILHNKALLPYDFIKMSN